ncbi:hypothetical protein LK494_00365 [Anaerovorax odorimutans]|nr:hypothetical protein [Anaerovorax odorimutans]
MKPCAAWNLAAAEQMCVSAGQFACDGVNTGIKTCSLRQAVIWIQRIKIFGFL